MTEPGPVDVAGRIARVRSAVGAARRGSELPDGVGDVPTMLDAGELRLLHHLARDVVEGWGAVAELGTFLGGSTVALGRGLQERGADGPRIDTYDLFVHEAWPAFGVGEGEDVQSRWEENVRGVRDLVDVHRGWLRAADAPEAPIELMFVDIVKHAETVREVMGFVERLVPGSVLVHQDMFHWGSPWVLVTVEAMWDRLAYAGQVARSSAVFVVTEPVADLAGAIDWAAVSPSAQLALLDQLAARFAHPTLRGSIETAALFLAKLTDPGIYRARLAATQRLEGPRLRRYVAEVAAADTSGAMRQSVASEQG